MDAQKEGLGEASIGSARKRSAEGQRNITLSPLGAKDTAPNRVAAGLLPRGSSGAR